MFRCKRRTSPLVLAVLLAAFLPGVASSAGEGPEGTTAGDAATVYTRAEVRSFFEESDGRFYIRLKVLPGWKIPFSTQNFRVADRSLIAGITEGESVRFTARHLAGENTLTAIHRAEPCKRLQPCH